MGSKSEVNIRGPSLGHPASGRALMAPRRCAECDAIRLSTRDRGPHVYCKCKPFVRSRRGRSHLPQLRSMSS